MFHKAPFSVWAALNSAVTRAHTHARAFLSANLFACCSIWLISNAPTGTVRSTSNTFHTHILRFRCIAFTHKQHTHILTCGVSRARSRKNRGKIARNRLWKKVALCSAGNCHKQDDSFWLCQPSVSFQGGLRISGDGLGPLGQGGLKNIRWWTLVHFNNSSLEAALWHQSNETNKHDSVR